MEIKKKFLQDKEGGILLDSFFSVMSMRKDRSRLQPLVLVLIYSAQGSLASHTTNTSEQSLFPILSNNLNQAQIVY